MAALCAVVAVSCTSNEQTAPTSPATTGTTTTTTTTLPPTSTTVTAAPTTTSTTTTTTTLPDPEVEDRLLTLDVSRGRRAEPVVDTIVLHFISDASRSPESPYDLEAILGIFEEFGVSAHYLIDREGIIHRLVEEERVAFHAGRGSLPWDPPRTNVLNDYSIGIEMMAIGSATDMAAFVGSSTYARVNESDVGFTPEQYTSLQWLINDIRKRWPEVEHDGRHVVGHELYAPDRRTDPGELFDWSRIGVTPPAER